MVKKSINKKMYISYEINHYNRQYTVESAFSSTMVRLVLLFSLFVIAISIKFMIKNHSVVNIIISKQIN